jgi:hypothetical protein
MCSLSLTQLDNDFKASLLQALYFKPDFPPETRERINERLYSFVHQEYIIPHIRKSVAELENEDTLDAIDPRSCRDSAIRLKDDGKKVIEFAEGGYTIGSFFSDDELYEFENLIRIANTEDEVLRLRDLARSKLGSFDHYIIKHAEQEFGNLKGCVGTKYPAATVIAEVSTVKNKE